MRHNVIRGITTERNKLRTETETTQRDGSSSKDEEVLLEEDRLYVRLRKRKVARRTFALSRVQAVLNAFLAES